MTQISHDGYGLEDRGACGHRPASAARLAWVVLFSVSLSMAVGCQSTSWLKQRRVPLSPLMQSLKLSSWSGPEPTARTQQWLRRYALDEEFADRQYEQVMEQANQIVSQSPTGENVYALAELAFLVGKQAESIKRHKAAFDMYGVAVAYAYLYLVDDKFDLQRNPYDPQFRQACDLYNGALESSLRLAQRDGPLTPGTTRSIETANHSIQLSIVSKGSWRPEQIERVEFSTDYQVQGLTNQYRTFGLGVPLVAVFRQDTQRPEEQFYSNGMSVPATAFLRVVPEQLAASSKSCHRCVVELHDPMVNTDVRLEDGRLVPLETDLSTPLAYSLSDPIFQETDIGTRGLLNPADSQSVQGIYLLEPYDPQKIPVLMVHGLWSSLMTWMEMFNDLRGTREIRDHYQFWFYLYPTGQPFWTTATQLRQDLAQARQVLDPNQAATALDQMVLVGHSMGGLVSKMQTLSSGDAFWSQISETPLDDLEIPGRLRSELRETWFFKPNESIRRVVTIGTPHQGSEFSNGTTQWLARTLIRLPKNFVENSRYLFADPALRDSEVLRINNSVESLSPQVPLFQLMLDAPRSADVAFHNVIGVVPSDQVIGKVAPKGDGVVKLESARLPGSVSEKIVPEGHVEIHRHPLTVLEVQRILLEHLNQLRQGGPGPVVADRQVQAASLSRLPSPR